MNNQTVSAEPTLTMPVYFSPVRDRNEMKYGTDGCFCCMRPLLNKEDSYHVHINTDMEALNPGLITEENCEELTGSESQGCFPVGNECAKKMLGFVFKYV